MTRMSDDELGALMGTIRRADAAPEELFLACIRLHAFSRPSADLLVAQQLRRALLKEMQPESRDASPPQGSAQTEIGEDESHSPVRAVPSDTRRASARRTGYSLRRRLGRMKLLCRSSPTSQAETRLLPVAVTAYRH